jgi:PPOX class probable F420-dependent enzyme
MDGTLPGVSTDPARLNPASLAFLTERHLATLTTLRRNGSPHVVPVGFTWDTQGLVARVISSRGSAKVAQARAGRRAAICQVQGRRWITLEGTTSVLEDVASVRDAEDRYAVRYRQPRPNPQRVVVVLDVDRVLGGSWPEPLPPSPYS